MRLVVMADTHVPSRKLTDEILTAAAAADLIIHAGDICTREALRRLQGAGPVAAVHGNNDDSQLRASLPGRLSFKLFGWAIEVIHGHQKRTAVTTARSVAAAMNGPGLVIFGHSHQPRREWVGDVLLLNPGSPTDPRFSREKTFAVCTVDETLDAEIVVIGSPPEG